MPARASDNPPGGTLIVLVCGGVVVAGWPLPGVHRADLGLVDEVARLALAARRLGCRIRLEHVDRQLTDLLILTGLADILAGEPPDGAGRSSCPG